MRLIEAPKTLPKKVRFKDCTPGSVVCENPVTKSEPWLVVGKSNSGATRPENLASLLDGRMYALETNVPEFVYLMDVTVQNHGIVTE
jgi:hypothetical protein